MVTLPKTGSQAIAIAMIVAAMLLFNGVIIAGTAYVVFWLGYSGWWWLLAIGLIAGSTAK